MMIEALFVVGFVDFHDDYKFHFEDDDDGDDDDEEDDDDGDDDDVDYYYYYRSRTVTSLPMNDL